MEAGDRLVEPGSVVVREEPLEGPEGAPHLARLRAGRDVLAGAGAFDVRVDPPDAAFAVAVERPPGAGGHEPERAPRRLPRALARERGREVARHALDVLHHQLGLAEDGLVDALEEEARVRPAGEAGGGDPRPVDVPLDHGLDALDLAPQIELPQDFQDQSRRVSHHPLPLTSHLLTSSPRSPSHHSRSGYSPSATICPILFSTTVRSSGCVIPVHLLSVASTPHPRLAAGDEPLHEGQG